MKAGGGELLMRGIRQQVARDLLDGELIEGHVAIHGVDDPIAIAPGVRTQAVAEETVAVGIACHVQPVPSPAFPEIGRGEKSIHNGGVFFV